MSYIFCCVQYRVLHILSQTYCSAHPKLFFISRRVDLWGDPTYNQNFFRKISQILFALLVNANKMGKISPKKFWLLSWTPQRSTRLVFSHALYFYSNYNKIRCSLAYLLCFIDGLQNMHGALYSIFPKI